MRWKGERESNHVEDRRGQSGLGGANLVSGKGKIFLLIVVLFAGYYGIDLTPLLNNDPVVSQTTSNEPLDQNDEAAQFTSVILASTEDTWSVIFKRMGRRYQEPKLVLYIQSTTTGCGVGQAIMGPFYCPADRTVYLDLSFYQDMKQRFGGGGEFAQAYVIAHEVGHHVQTLLGTADKVRQLQQGQSAKRVNQLSVMLELQADCYAGVWGHSLQDQHILEQGDLESALRTAQAIGDDRLQKRQTGQVVPDSFTHGTSQQRYNWFLKGYQTGDMTQCDTFGGIL
ncbi:neutral zinc metallopeptidase [Utexia brackfieldae]|uniref:KPN_02809 family neutral zinc metallopeptidase n=1 Tax=Utexia brackfieldae TaxID=3074108 RepID=UPI00370D0AA1